MNEQSELEYKTSPTALRLARGVIAGIMANFREISRIRFARLGGQELLALEIRTYLPAWRLRELVLELGRVLPDEWSQVGFIFARRSGVLTEGVTRHAGLAGRILNEGLRVAF